MGRLCQRVAVGRPRRRGPLGLSGVGLSVGPTPSTPVGASPCKGRHTKRVLTTREGATEEHLPGLDLATAPSPTPDTRNLYMLERGGWSLVWLAVLTGGVNVWGFWWSSPYIVALAPLMILSGLVGTAACWLTASPRSRLFQALAFVGVMATVVFPQAIEIHTRKFYTTDSAAFEHVAARALVHGSDPYVVSMSPAAHLLQVPGLFWTYTVNGGHVSQFSYPAGSFLLDAPAMALGFHHAIVDWMDLIAWLVSGFLLFVLLPTSLRWLAALVVLIPALLGSFTSGETDAMFVPFLVLAVWRWDRFGQGRQAGLARWVGPIALGLACAIKQTPWFCVPLLVTGVFLEARLAGRAAIHLALRYLLVVVAVFGAVNLPFVLWQPGAWLHGVLIPVVGGLVADGQGLVSLATHGVSGGVDLTALSLAAGLALVTVVTAFAVWYPYLKRIWLLLVPIPLFFSPRSLSSYLIDLFPAAIVAALSVRTISRGSPAGSDRWRRVRRLPVLAVGIPALGVVVASVLAFVAPPLQLTVRNVALSHAGRVVDAVTVSVHNRTGAALTPHFMVNTGDNPHGFWLPSDHRRVTLKARGSETLTLYPPMFTVAPQKGARWLVEAYTGAPASLSTSPLNTFAGARPPR